MGFSKDTLIPWPQEKLCHQVMEWDTWYIDYMYNQSCVRIFKKHCLSPTVSIFSKDLEQNLYLDLPVDSEKVGDNSFSVDNPQPLCN